MTVTARWRFTLQLLLLVLSALAVTLSASVLPGTPAPRAIGEVHRSLMSWNYVLPAVAAVAAVVGRRLRDARLPLRAVGLRGPRVVVEALLALALTPTLVMTVTAVARVVVHGHSLGLDLVPPVVPTFLAALGAASLGALLGVLVRPVIAAPAALAAAFVLVAAPPALEPLWVRHLTSLTSTCCSVDTAPAPSGYLAAAATFGTIAFAVGALVVALTAFERGGRRRVPWLAGGLVLGIALACVAVPVARRTNLDALTERPGQPACRPASGLQLCLWPEDEPRRSAVEGLLARAQRTAGPDVPMPRRVVEVERGQRWPDVALSGAPRDDNELAAFVAEAITPGASCPRRTIAARDTLVQWWGRQLGSTAWVGGDADRLLDAPEPRQHAWVVTTTRALVTCRPVAPPR